MNAVVAERVEFKPENHCVHDGSQLLCCEALVGWCFLECSAEPLAQQAVLGSSKAHGDIEILVDIVGTNHRSNSHH